MNRVTFALLFVLVVTFNIMHAPGADAQAQFRDGDFTNWQATNVIVSGPASSVASLAQTGGNPGAYWSVGQYTPWAPQSSPPSAIAVLSSPTGGFNYNPSTEGAIANISFSVDTENLNSLQAFGLGIVQNGKVYGNLNFISAGTWTTTSTTYLLSDFGLVIPVTDQYNYPDIAIDSTRRPDFSSSGSQISLGLLTANSTSGQTVVGFDNFSVTITPAGVPETGSLLIAGIGFLAGGAFLQRRRFSSNPDV